MGAQDGLDGSCAYTAVPLSHSVDFYSRERSDGLQYRVGLHHVRLFGVALGSRVGLHHVRPSGVQGRPAPRAPFGDLVLIFGLHHVLSLGLRVEGRPAPRAHLRALWLASPCAPLKGGTRGLGF